VKNIHFFSITSARNLALDLSRRGYSARLFGKEVYTNATSQDVLNRAYQRIGAQPDSVREEEQPQ
jgi:hypothetical protein